MLLRVFELLLDRGAAVCVLAGNHDEALGYDGVRFTASVSPSDFVAFLNANLAHEWIVRAGKLAVRLFADAPRALFFPDGLLAAHGGFPLADVHAALRAGADWNDPRCLSDFAWTRAHPKAREKLPNRSTRGGSFGREDFAAFCALAAELGRPVTRLVRGHDHVEERWAVWPAYARHPLLTTDAMSRRLPREAFGPYERVPTAARSVPGALPQLHRLHVPGGNGPRALSRGGGAGRVSVVVLRCPNHGTTQGAPGECEAAQAYPRSGVALVYLARIRRMRADEVGALESLAEAARREPGLAIAQRELGALHLVRAQRLALEGAPYEAAGDMALAERYLARARALDPADRATRGYYACALAANGRAGEAAAELAAAGPGPWAPCAGGGRR